MCPIKEEGFDGFLIFEGSRGATALFSTFLTAAHPGLYSPSCIPALYSSFPLHPPTSSLPLSTSCNSYQMSIVVKMSHAVNAVANFTLSNYSALVDKTGALESLSRSVSFIRHNMKLAEKESSHLSFGGALRLHCFLNISLNIILF